jgi:hypothetical protein
MAATSINPIDWKLRRGDLKAFTLRSSRQSWAVTLRAKWSAWETQSKLERLATCYG